MRTQGRREIAEKVIVALLCELAVQGVVIVADLLRRRLKLPVEPSCPSGEKREE